MKKSLFVFIALVAVTAFPSAAIGQQKKMLGIEKNSVKVVKKVIPSVVSIYVIPESQKTVVPNRRTIYGSGAVLTSNGLILTSLQLVSRRGHKIFVFLTNGKRFRGKIIGQDKKYKLALVKINATGLTPIKMGDPSEVYPGTLTFKFGNAFQTAKNYLPSVNMGTVSGLKKLSDGNKLIRIDADINRGDYGGPLVNVEGELIGIILPLTINRGTNTFISYAVPVSTLKKVLPDLKTGYIGILLTVTNKGKNGALVEAIDPHGPAAKGNLKVGDRIVEFEGHSISNPQDLINYLKKYPAGERVSFTIIRGSSKIKVNLTLGLRQD